MDAAIEDGMAAAGAVGLKRNTFTAAIIASWKCAEKMTKTFGGNKKMLVFLPKKGTTKSQ